MILLHDQYTCYVLPMISLQSLYDVNTFLLRYCYVLSTICALAMCRIFVIATWHVTALTTLLVSHYWLIVVEWCWEWEWQKMGCTYGMIFMSLLHSSYALYMSLLRSCYALAMLLLCSCYVLHSYYALATFYILTTLSLRFTFLICTTLWFALATFAIHSLYFITMHFLYPDITRTPLLV